MSKLVKVYKYDEYGHYVEPIDAQIDPLGTEVLLPPDCVTFKPASTKLDTCWAVLNKKKTAWEYVAKPTTAAECVGIKVKHDDHCAWAEEMRTLIAKYTAEDSNYYVYLYDDLTQTVKPHEMETLEKVKSGAVEHLSQVYKAFQNQHCSELYVTSSAGVCVNADLYSQGIISALIGTLENATDTVSYKLYDDSFKDLSRADLETILKDCRANLLALQAQKWAFQNQINAAESVEEVKAITFDFVMQDYSA